MTATKILLIGHSHTRSILEAARKYPDASLSLKLLDLFEERFWSADGAVAFAAVRLQAVDDAADADAVVLCLWGNEPNALSLIASDRPFDFLLPGRECEPLLPEHEIVPVGLVRRTLESLTVPGFYELFSGLFDCPVYVISTPPPIEDPTYIARHPGTARERLKGRTIGSAALRLKTWRLYCQLVRTWASKAGFRFIETPPTNLSERGFLNPDALSGDATHGNAWYGRNMIDQIKKALADHG